MGHVIEKPWELPGYTGKLRSTPSIYPINAPEPVIDDLIGLTLEWLIDDVITQETALKLLTHYENLKQEGHWTYPR